MRLLLLWIHLLSAAVWVGGFAFSLLLFTSFKQAGQTAEQLPFLQRIEKGLHFTRSRAMELLLITGIFNFVARGMASGFQFSPAFYPVLAAKLILFVVMFALQILDGRVFMARRHAWLANPEGLATPLAETVRQSLRRSTRVAAFNLALSLVVLYLALSLSRF